MRNAGFQMLMFACTYGLLSDCSWFDMLLHQSILGWNLCEWSSGGAPLILLVKLPLLFPIDNITWHELKLFHSLDWHEILTVKSSVKKINCFRKESCISARNSQSTDLNIRSLSPANDRWKLKIMILRQQILQSTASTSLLFQSGPLLSEFTNDKTFRNHPLTGFFSIATIMDKTWFLRYKVEIIETGGHNIKIKGHYIIQESPVFLCWVLLRTEIELYYPPLRLRSFIHCFF